MEQVYRSGQEVYFKEKDKTGWTGPAKVCAQDGKIVFIRYGNFLRRVPTCRVMHRNEKNVIKYNSLLKKNMIKHRSLNKG